MLDLPSRSFRNSNAHEHLSSLSKIGAFSDELQSTKVDVGSRNDGDETFLGSLELVLDNEGLESGESESSGGFSDHSSFWSNEGKRESRVSFATRSPSLLSSSP